MTPLIKWFPLLTAGPVPGRPCAAPGGGLPALHRALHLLGGGRHAEEAARAPQDGAGRHHQGQGRPPQGAPERGHVRCDIENRKYILL